MKKIMDISVSVIATTYSILNTYDLYTKMRNTQDNVINSTIKDSVEYSYITYVKPHKDNNNWTTENHKKANIIAKEYFNTFYPKPILALIDLNETKIDRKIKDRLIFLKNTGIVKNCCDHNTKSL